MLETMTFYNHLGEAIEFGKNGIFANYNELRDFKWNYTERNSRIVSFSHDPAERKLPVIIICNEKEEGIRKMNRLTEVMEKDIFAVTPGKMVINGYYMPCYITGSEKDNYLYFKGHMTAELTVTTDNPYWFRESLIRFGVGGSVSAGSDLDYPHDFPYDFHSGSEFQGTVTNPGYVDSDFIMTIYGVCENPAILINSVLYQVNIVLNAGEKLVINSVDKKIYKVLYDGTEVNIFNARNRESYIFTKIQPGRNVVIWDGSFTFDVTITEKRSEPKWI